MRIAASGLVVICTLLRVAECSAQGELQSGEPTKIGNGTMVVCWKRSSLETRPKHAMVHFHGGSEYVKRTFKRSRLNVVLIVVNFPGLSSAYSKPFQDNPMLFKEILNRARIPDPQSLTLSSFSAGYGAIREILKHESFFDQVDTVVTADSIYAGLEKNVKKREASKLHMRDFLRFARMAIQTKKTFIISHSAQQTSYASTTETADYLIRKLMVTRTNQRVMRSERMQQVTQAKRGTFLVFGFDGETGKDHMEHLHNIDFLWSRIPGVQIQRPL